MIGDRKRISRFRLLAVAGVFLFLALACRTTDVFSSNSNSSTDAAQPTLRPTFTPAVTTAAKAAPTATRPRAQTARAATAPPTNTPAPQPTQPPAPTPTPQGPYFRVSGRKCEAGGNTRIVGTVYSNGVKINAFIVRVSAVPGGPGAINDVETGRDPNDPKRVDSALDGQYRLALYEGKLVAGNWFVFIINRNGDILSEMGNVQTSEGPGCNIATIDFGH